MEFLYTRGRKLPPDNASLNDFATYKIIRGPLEPFMTTLSPSKAVDVLTCLQSPPFNDERWACRGQSRADWGLQPGIERHANKP
jgi:hypothetical protein